MPGFDELISFFCFLNNSPIGLFLGLKIGGVAALNLLIQAAVSNSCLNAECVQILLTGSGYKHKRGQTLLISGHILFYYFTASPQQSASLSDC